MIANYKRLRRQANVVIFSILAILAAFIFGRCRPPSPGYPPADLPDITTVSVVPEPGTYALTACGVLLATIVFRKLRT